jgi:hypothetical protein
MSVILYFLPANRQILEKIAAEICLDGFGQIRWVARLAQKSRAPLDNFFPKRSHIGRDHW